jgi:DNA adenine methylase
MIYSPLKWHGGKSYLAKRIAEIAETIPHIHWVEPYFGSGAVTFALDPGGRSEVINDVHLDLTNFWRTLQDPILFKQFQVRMSMTPFSKVEWKAAERSLCNPDNGSCIDRACWFFVLCRQSLAGRMDTFSPLTKTRLRSGMNGEVSAWLGSIDGLAEVHTRLKRVVIFGEKALDVMRREDGKDTLFYLDPPYLPSTRISPRVYLHEMTWADHEEMLRVIGGLEGKVILSGYDNSLYSEALTVEKGWERQETEMANHAAGGKEKRRMVEVLWIKRWAGKPSPIGKTFSLFD